MGRVNGLYLRVRWEPDRPCLLIIAGALEDGRKELVPIDDAIRESEQSWQDVLRDLKARELEEGPTRSVGDRALGFRATLDEEFPTSRRRR